MNHEYEDRICEGCDRKETCIARFAVIVMNKEIKDSYRAVTECPKTRRKGNEKA